MSDETEGWHRKGDFSLRKRINGQFFLVSIGKDNYRLTAGDIFCATRPTLRECQILAHATARLWSGSDE